MSFEQTKVTSKFQVTIPTSARKALGLQSGRKITWHAQQGRVFIDMRREIKSPAKFLTSQPSTGGVDVLELLREVRKEISERSGCRFSD